MELTKARVTQGDVTGRDRRAGEQSVSSAFEHLLAGSQSVITKRIELALLEVRELLSRTLQRTALVGVGIVLAAAAWFAVAACVVLLITPDASLLVRLAAFGLLNWGAALGLVALAIRLGAAADTAAPRRTMGPAPQRDGTSRRSTDRGHD